MKKHWLFTDAGEEAKTEITWRPHHHYVDFQVAYCYGVPDDARKGIEEDLKDPNSEIRRDIRERFKDYPPGEYSIAVLVPPHRWITGYAYCVVKFRKIR
jgi:hypothetical protein